jgi:hypothetical protein
MRKYAAISGAAAMALFLSPALAGAQVLDVDYDDPMLTNQWVLGVAVGGTMDTETAEDESWSYGGSFDYLREGIYGFEFLADFAPDFEATSRFLSEPNINSYMFNGILAAPLGDGGAWQPYLSGGVGVMTLDSKLFNEDPSDTAAEDFFEVDDNQFAANFGGGLMGWGGNIGFRADIRYFTDMEGDDTELDPDIPQFLGLQDVSFWRANGGIAFRW